MIDCENLSIWEWFRGKMRDMALEPIEIISLYLFDFSWVELSNSGYSTKNKALASSHMDIQLRLAWSFKSDCLIIVIFIALFNTSPIH